MRVSAARVYPHGVAVGVLASIGVLLGAGFAALQIALRSGLSYASSAI